MNIKKLIKNKLVIFIILAFMVVVGGFGIKEAIKTDHAHQSFENYYAFRGCTQLVKRTDTYGLCKISSGQTIKLVKFQGKWYLDGDLPVCIFNSCF